MQTDSCQVEYCRIFWVGVYLVKEQTKPGGQDTEGVLRATPRSAKPVVEDLLFPIHLLAVERLQHVLIQSKRVVSNDNVRQLNIHAWQGRRWRQVQLVLVDRRLQLATLPLAPVSQPTFCTYLHILCETIVRINKSQHLHTAVTLIIIEERPRVFRFYNSEGLVIYGSYTVWEIPFHLVATCYLFPLIFGLGSL